MTNLNSVIVPRYEYKQPLSVIALASGKGGVGKTSISVNLAVALAELGNSVMLLDADLGLGNVDVALGIRPKYTLDHVVSGARSLQEIVVEGPAGVRIIPSGSGISDLANLPIRKQFRLIQAFSEIEFDVDHLLVDVGAGIHSSVINFAGACQEMTVVVCDEPASITDAYALIKVLRQERHIKKFKILTNMVKSDLQGRQLFAKLSDLCSRFLDVHLSYFGMVPSDDYLKVSLRQQQPAVDSFPQSEYAKAIKRLACLLHKRPPAEVTTTGLGFFFERLIENDLRMESS